jgi:hypothetical protein
MKKVLLSVLFLASISTITSCKKEGCTDPDSINYDADAKKDNGTCEYEGKVVFWYNGATADSLIANDAISLTYYVDGQVVGSSAASVYWTGAPNCDQSGSVTVKKALGSVKNKSYTYSIKDQSGFEFWSGVTNYTANTCLKLQLTY